VASETSPDVLGPNNYCLYTKPVGESIKQKNIISSSIEACIEDISTWMNGNMLKLNKEQDIINCFFIQILREEN